MFRFDSISTLLSLLILLTSDHKIQRNPRKEILAQLCINASIILLIPFEPSCLSLSLCLSFLPSESSLILLSRLKLQTLNMDVRSRRARQTSPDRAKLSMQQHRHRQPPKPNPTRKVQVVYYLTRNGHLEHPHYMEVSHFATQPLRLKGKTIYYIFF